MAKNTKVTASTVDNGEKAILRAFDEMERFLRSIANKDYVVVVDYTQPSTNRRLYLCDGVTRETLEQHHVAHGSGSSDHSDPKYARYFSNTPDSHMSSLGGMVTVETYNGKHGYSCRLRGLEPSNSNVMRRAIVIHSSNYVTDVYIRETGRAGQSWGCLAMDPAITKAFIDKVKGGVFVYTYYG